MIDHFARLAQPRRPWLDPEELRQAFHARTLQSHPDVGGEADFAGLNEAYQVLREPKRRLQHLFALEECAPDRQAEIPPELAELFPQVATLTHQADAVLRQISDAGNALNHSLAKGAALQVRARLEEMLRVLREQTAAAEAELRMQDESWRQNLASLHLVYLRFSYLSRWIAELEEKELRLTL